MRPVSSSFDEYFDTLLEQPKPPQRDDISRAGRVADAVVPVDTIPKAFNIDAVNAYLDALLRRSVESTEGTDGISPIEGLEAATPVIVADVEPEALPELLATGEGVSPAQDSFPRPALMNKPFACLLCTVAGVTYAIPLVNLLKIHPLDSALRHIPGQSDRLLGVTHYEKNTVKVIDSAKYFMGRRAPSQAPEYQYLLLLPGLKMAFACETILSTVTIDPDTLKWRGERPTRSWFAGSIAVNSSQGSDTMYALLDIEQLEGLVSASL